MGTGASDEPFLGRFWSEEASAVAVNEGGRAGFALNHTIKDKTAAAYRRGDLFDKRRELMVYWEQFVASKTPGRKTGPARRAQS